MANMPVFHPMPYVDHRSDAFSLSSNYVVYPMAIAPARNENRFSTEAIKLEGN
jgi:hypothetical protein